MKKTAVLLITALLVACGPKEQQTQTSTASTGAALTINGAGATFPYPLYSKWFDRYHGAHPNAQINYQSIGSGGGIKQLSAQTVFFGASDMPMTEAQLKAAPGPVLHFPTVLGAVVPTYNLAGAALRFSGPLLADLYLGKVAHEDIPVLFARVADGVVKAPEYVPPMFRDMNGLSIWTAYSNFFFRMGGSVVDDYYAKLFRRGDG